MATGFRAPTVPMIPRGMPAPRSIPRGIPGDTGMRSGRSRTGMMGRGFDVNQLQQILAAIGQQGGQDDGLDAHEQEHFARLARLRSLLGR